MGYTTDFIGHIDIEPALNQDEIEYLTAFSASRRFDRVDGPYAVPGNPSAEDQLGRGDVDVDRYNRTAPGQPQLWCQWVPCWDGCCVSFDGREKFYEPVLWLGYLINHFLKPNGLAGRSGVAQFDAFTFDHVLNGLVIGCRRDTKRLFTIRVTDNVVTEEELMPGLEAYSRRGPLPYEVEIDRTTSWARRRRPKSPDRKGDDVIELSARRARSSS